MTDDLFAPTTPPNLGAPPPRRCMHPAQFRETREVRDLDRTIRYQRCTRCGHELDPAKQRAGRNARLRGNREELTVARALGGVKVGPMGWPWDVVIEGLFRIQVRKYLRPEGLKSIAKHLALIANTPGPEAAAYVWVEPGRGGDQLIVMRLRDFTAYTGIGIEDSA